jgi:hypothetical protein
MFVQSGVTDVSTLSSVRFDGIAGIFMACAVTNTLLSNFLNNDYQRNLKYVEVPEGVQSLASTALSYATANEIRLPSSLTTITSSGFSSLYSIEKFNIPQSLVSIYASFLNGKNGLKFIEFPINYDISAINANMNFVAVYTWAVEWFYHLADRLKDNTGGTTITLNMGAYNISRIPDDAIATLTSKNYSLA